MPRYYFGDNAARPVRVGGQAFAFEIVSIAGGTHQGVIAIADSDVDAFLSVARGVVEEIAEEAYRDFLQKKSSSHRSPPIPDSAPPARPGPPLKGAGAVEVEGKGKAHPLAGGPADDLPATMDDAVDVGRCDSVPDATPTKATTRRQNHKAKRGIE
jgi:hypothetical protein